MFKYNAEIIRVIDGDTVVAMVDLGFSTWTKTTIRFYGINTPESRTRDLEEKARGLAAKGRLMEMLESNDNKFILQSHGIGKYGRCLGTLYVPNVENEKELIDINMTLVNEGHAVEYMGGKR
jgi:micrococcal nuclease